MLNLFFYDKILQNLTQERFYSIFNKSIEADRKVNDLFTGSNSVNKPMWMVTNKLKL